MTLMVTNESASVNCNVRMRWISRIENDLKAPKTTNDDCLALQIVPDLYVMHIYKTYIYVCMLACVIVCFCEMEYKFSISNWFEAAAAASSFFVLFFFSVFLQQRSCHRLATILIVVALFEIFNEIVRGATLSSRLQRERERKREKKKLNKNLGYLSHWLNKVVVFGCLWCAPVAWLVRFYGILMNSFAQILITFAVPILTE